ncbi:DUF1176 domain-containing protein [Pelagibacterium sp. 26DY04]|uniref:DUF1176 domain-containing protein n=1 Tax=Pelagibacterium sp. 26DY04 TaxID=2967130 RepID=UPI002815B2CE|nr:DUF1176 domain-containing protein [Pelagibacterium sp. 26DY04]WMT85321.1 DUF1176 domain-containing protein [Pelagibacterium sp. 26DY04]
MRVITLLTITLALAPGAAWAQQAGDIAESAAFAHFSQAFNQLCLLDEESAAAEYNPHESWELSWETGYSDEPETTTLYKFFCGAGAYNLNHIYYLDTEYDGPLPISFAVPDFDVIYENDDYEGAVLDIPLTGYDTQLVLINSEFDPQTRTITSHGLWRGLGDAFSAGTWEFDLGRFILKHYEVDAQYDGEANPKTLVEFD